MISGSVEIDNNIVATWDAVRGDEVRPGEFQYECTCEFQTKDNETRNLVLNIEHVAEQGVLTLAARILNAAHFQFQPEVSKIP